MMKKKNLVTSVLLLAALAVSLCGCVDRRVFTKIDEEHYRSPSGTEYAFLANEGILSYFGELEYAGRAEDDPVSIPLFGGVLRKGFFALKEADDDNILIRKRPRNEWYAIYRKSSLPAFDYSVDNCSRLELIRGSSSTYADVSHRSCGDGITDGEEIAAFLADVRTQKNPEQAGLHDLVRKPDGKLENCYTAWIICGFFEEEPNVFLPMPVTSYNDLAYSVRIRDIEYVLPPEWIPRLLAPGESFP